MINNSTNPHIKSIKKNSGITAKLFKNRFSEDKATAEAWAASVIARSNIVRVGRVRLW